MNDLRAPCPPLPTQPLYRDDQGVVRFKANAIVECLLERHPMSLEQVLDQPFGDDEKIQFLQLIGSARLFVTELGFSDHRLESARVRRGSIANANHPIQPLDLDRQGVLRFQENSIVRMLLDTGPEDLNSLAIMDHSKKDREQMAQLIGYSHSGAGDLSYMSNRVYSASYAEWEQRDVLFRQAQLESNLPDAPHVPSQGPRF